MVYILQCSVMVLAVALVPMTWYSTLMPHWLSQSGERNATVYYSQGMGLWLNYTEHVGDPTFDPGNSLWVPAQESGANTYSGQCTTQRSFCVDVIGELHRQYCQVMKVYCGTAMTFLQVALSLLAGFALVVMIWALHLITTSHCTIADKYLMHLCILNATGLLASAVIWYAFVYVPIINSAFYKDQYSRCSENNSGRTCWQMGRCVYLLTTGGLLNSILAILVMLHVGNKFQHFQHLLRRMYETTVVVDAPDHVVEMKSKIVNSLHSETSGAVDAALDGEEDLESMKPAALLKHPSAVLALQK